MKLKYESDIISLKTGILLLANRLQELIADGSQLKDIEKEINTIQTNICRELIGLL